MASLAGCCPKCGGKAGYEVRVTITHLQFGDWKDSATAVDQRTAGRLNSGAEAMTETATDGSMKSVLHSWATPWGHVRIIDGPRPAGMGLEHLNAERNEWESCAPLELMFTKEIIRLLCEVRRITALYDNEQYLRTRDNDTWRQRHENLRDLWNVIGDSLRRRGYVGGGESSDVWPARVEGLLKEVEAQRDRENQFAQVLSDRESSTRYLLKERKDQCDHAIRVNREEAGQAGYDRALADIGYSISIGMIAAERRRQVEKEGYTTAHDDKHDAGELALGAACYALESAGRGSVEYRLGNGGLNCNVDALGLYWPWDSKDWKPADEIRNLIKAGALIAAEIDRRLRAGEGS